MFAARIGENATFYVFTIFLLVYAKHIGLPAWVATSSVAIGSVGQAIAMVAGGALSDRLGRRPVAIAAAFAAGAWTIAFFPLVASQRQGLVLAAVGIGLVLHGLLTGAQAAFYAELFNTAVRYSGVSIGYQAATVLAGAAGPLAGAALLEKTGSPLPVAAILACALLLTVLGMSIAPETRQTELA